MQDPDEPCRHCGARFDAHKAAGNGGFDCPPRDDGKVPFVVGWRHRSYAVDEVYAEPIIEWRDPEPKDAVEALQMAQEKTDG